MCAKHLTLTLLAGLALPAFALAAADPLNMPPSANDPLNSAPPAPPKSSAAEAARAAQESVVTGNSIIQDARAEVAASREEARRNLDAGVRGQAPPTRTTGPGGTPSVVQQAAEDTGVFDGMDAEERAAAEQAIASMPTFDVAGTLGEECAETNFDSQKSKVRTGLTLGQQYMQQNIAAMRATGQAEFIALADKLEKQQRAYSNIDERVEQVGGKNECEGPSQPKAPKTPSAKRPKTPGSKAPQPSSAQDSKTPSGGSGGEAPPKKEPDVVTQLLLQEADARHRLERAEARLAEAEKQYRDAIAQGRTPNVPEDVANLPAEVAALKDRVAFLNGQIELAVERERAADQMQPGLTPDGPRSLPQHEPNETRTTDEIRRDLQEQRSDATKRFKEAKARWDEVLRQEQAARARGVEPPPRSERDEQARRDVEYQQARIIDADRQLRDIANGATPPPPKPVQLAPGLTPDEPRSLPQHPPQEYRTTEEQRRDLQDQRSDAARRLKEAKARYDEVERREQMARDENKDLPPRSAEDEQARRDIQYQQDRIIDADIQLRALSETSTKP